MDLSCWHNAQAQNPKINDEQTMKFKTTVKETIKQLWMEWVNK